MSEQHTPTSETEAQPETHHPDAQSSPSPVLVVFLVIPLVGILVALVMIALEGNPQGRDDALAPQNNGVLVNNPAPDFQVQNMDGERLQLADYSGRTLVLNFWQTTCVPCVRELPALADFAAEQAEREGGAAVLAINFEETTQMISDFFAENGIGGVPIALDPDSTVRRTYGVQGIPTTFIIAPDGTIRFRHLGEVTFEELADYVDLVATTDPSA